MHSAPTGLRSLHPTLWVRMALLFVERFLDTMIAPLVTLYLANELGATLAGLLMLGAVGVAFIAGLLSGHVSDRHGRRPALLVSALLNALALGGMALAVAPWWGSSGRNSVAGVYVCYTVFVAMAGWIRPVHDAMIIDLAPQDQRRTVYALNYWSTNVALGAGVLLGAFLYGRYFGALLAGAALLAVLAAVATAILVRESAPPTAQPAPGGIGMLLRGYGPPLRDTVFLRLLVAFTLVLGIELQLWSGFAAVYIAETMPRQPLLPSGGPSFTVDGVELLGILRAENTVLVVVLAVVVERLSRATSDARRIFVGLALFVAGYVTLILGNRPHVMLAAVAVFTIGELLHIPVMQTLLAQLVPDDARTRYMAVFHLNVRGAMAIAAISLTVGGLLPAAAVAAGYIALAAIAVLLYRSILRRVHAGRTPAPMPYRPRHSLALAAKGGRHAARR